MSLPAAASADELIPELVRELDLSTAQFGAFHSQTIVVLNRLAKALRKTGDADQAIHLLDQALDWVALSSTPDHPVRSDLLCTLGELMVERGHWGKAASIYREILECCTQRSGLNHETSLAAEGDLAVVLSELGIAGAAEIEGDALSRARMHLGKAHPVTSVLAWNRALRLEDDGDSDSARAILENDLLWLLSEDQSELPADQQTLREMIAKRWGWDAASVC